MDNELLILVDEQDRETGLKEKLSVHRDADLHRAISVFLFNSKGELLLQCRATTKYHSGGLWTNTCCSHPRPGEATQEAAQRRLQEEMGLRCDNLQHAFHFIYKARLDHGLTEHELDHVFVGRSDATPQPNPDEVSAYRYATLAETEDDLQLNPHHYTAWFGLAFDRVKQLPGLVSA